MIHHPAEAVVFVKNVYKVIHRLNGSFAVRTEPIVNITAVGTMVLYLGNVIVQIVMMDIK